MKTARKRSNLGKGKRFSSHGYVQVSVPEHPFAEKCGYLYEHRLVMEKIIGRYLRSEEMVHHKNGNKADNNPENLVLVANAAEHLLLHRKRKDLRNPGEPNSIITCACGCGEELLKYDNMNRPRKYIHGHHENYKLSYNPDETILCECGCGTTINKFDKHGRTRRFIPGHNILLKYDKVYRVKKG